MNASRTRGHVALVVGVLSVIVSRWRRLRDGGHVPLALFSAALCVRLIAVPLAYAGLNPYALSDAIGFAAAAQYLAAGVVSGDLIVDTATYLEGMNDYDGHEWVHLSDTYVRWGLLLMPFWLVPGPSHLYATLAVATLGAGAVYNVARIGTSLHSPLAGAVAALPVAFSPSFVFVHTAIIRDAAILFALTTIGALAVCQSRPFDWSTPTAIRIGAVCALMVVILRPEYGVLLALGTLTAVAVWSLNHLVGSTPAPRLAALPIVATPVVTLTSIPYLAPVHRWLLEARAARHRERLAYLEPVPMETAIDGLVWGTVLALYFLLAPFPWMVETVGDAVLLAESALMAVFLVAAVWGIVYTVRYRPTLTAAFVVPLMAAIVFFGLGNANVGTAIRHRQSVSWLVFVFGSVALATWREPFWHKIKNLSGLLADRW